MSDRFYQQQLQTLGTCPGVKNPKRRVRVSWTDEMKEEAVQMYTEASPTPENSMEIVKEIAEKLDKTPNGVRMILSKAEVYVSVGEAAKSKSSGSTGGGRVSKAAAQEALIAAITDAGQEVDEDVVSKLTGKAAVYFTGLLSAVNN